MEPYDVCLLSKFDVYSFSMIGNIEISNWSFCWLPIGHFADFELSKVDIHFANFEQDKTVPICSFLLTVDRSQLCYSVWVRHTKKNNPNPLCLIKNSWTMHRISGVKIRIIKVSGHFWWVIMDPKMLSTMVGRQRTFSIFDALVWLFQHFRYLI